MIIRKNFVNTFLAYRSMSMDPVIFQDGIRVLQEKYTGARTESLLESLALYYHQSDSRGLHVGKAFHFNSTGIVKKSAFEGLFHPDKTKWGLPVTVHAEKVTEHSKGSTFSFQLPIKSDSFGVILRRHYYSKYRFFQESLLTINGVALGVWRAEHITLKDEHAFSEDDFNVPQNLTAGEHILSITITVLSEVWADVRYFAMS